MTLPTAGISFADVNLETGAAVTRSLSMSWIHDNTKAGQRTHDLANVRGKAWYQKSNEGNCSNGNCNCAANCGNIQCVNCFSSQCVNCTNCDARAWIQGNCNCACTYNCNANAVSYNCNCDCDCACLCDCSGNTCFLPGTQVFMADGSTKAIEDIQVGDRVKGSDLSVNRVIGLWRPKLAQRSMYSVNEYRVITTGDHLLLTAEGWAAIDSKAYAKRKHRKVTLIGGLKVSLSGLDEVLTLKTGTLLRLFNGELEAVRSIERIPDLDPATQLYTLATDGTFSFALASGVVVDGLPQKAHI